MKYHFKIHKEGKKFWAECIELEGCNTQGNTKEELFENMKEALNLYLDEPEGSKISFPPPKKTIKGRNIIEVPVNPNIAWAISLKKARLDRGLTQKEVAHELRMKSIFSYQKLESAKTANPELNTIVKIKTVFPELNLEDLVSTSVFLRGH